MTPEIDTIDIVVKVGGALLRDPHLLALAVEGIGHLACGADRADGRSMTCLVVPGGGPFADAVRMVLVRHAEQTIVLVGHDSVNRVLLLGFLGLPLSAYWRIAQDPCCINEIDIGGGTVCIRGINETQHLDTVATEHNMR